jgi:hypothetical protein
MRGRGEVSAGATLTHTHTHLEVGRDDALLQVSLPLHLDRRHARDTDREKESRWDEGE